jgi:hypothetical protein
MSASASANDIFGKAAKIISLSGSSDYLKKEEFGKYMGTMVYTGPKLEVKGMNGKKESWGRGPENITLKGSMVIGYF